MISHDVNGRAFPVSSHFRWVIAGKKLTVWHNDKQINEASLNIEPVGSARIMEIRWGKSGPPEAIAIAQVRNGQLLVVYGQDKNVYKRLASVDSGDATTITKLSFNPAK